MAYISAGLVLKQEDVITCTCSISSLSTTCTLKELLNRAEGLLVLRDRVPLYNYAFESSKLDYIQKAFGIQNYTERWYHAFKRRTRRFFNNSPIKDPTRAIE